MQSVSLPVSDGVNRTRLPWLEPAAAELAVQIDSGQLAHALLIHGQHGIGKRRLAAWLAQALLGSDRPVWPAESAPETTLHANLHPAAPETGKLLPVERIRELIVFMQLSTYGSGARVAAVCPAESMTRSAANSLLKILEEPQPDSYILLVADDPAQLPATIISRCRLLRSPAVPRETALAWLSEQESGVNWENALRLAGGGPLTARQLHGEGLDERARAMSSQLASLERRATTPLEVARSWKDLPMRFCCDFLFRCAFRRIQDWTASGKNAYKQRFSVLPAETREEMIRQGFVHLDTVMDCRRIERFNPNTELAVTVLLKDWYGGFSARR